MFNSVYVTDRHYCCLSLYVLFLLFIYNKILISVSETLYWFGDNNYAEWNELFRKYHAPKYYLPRLTAAYSFGVAGS